MSRGKILHLTRKEVVQRGLSQIIAVPELPTPPPGTTWPADAGNRRIGYRLEGGFNGGFDPEASHCASWSYGGRSPTADCIGFVLWASGIDRMQPTYSGTRDEWLNCASILDDAYGTSLPKNTRANVFTRPLQPSEVMRPGDWLLDRGHISLVVCPPTRVRGPVVVDCSPRHDSTRQCAINLGAPWGTQTKVVVPLFYDETD